MLKNLLKTSVSALVLLGALSSFDPSYAGQKQGRMKQEDDDQSHSNNNKKKYTKSKKENSGAQNIILKDPIDQILTPFHKEEFSFPKKIKFETLKATSEDDYFHKIYVFENQKHDILNKAGDIIRTIPPYTGKIKLPKDIQLKIFSFLDAKSMLISKGVCQSWYFLIHTYIEKLENQSPAQFLTHPIHILKIQEKLAPRFPYQPLNLRPDENAEIIIEELSHDQNFLLGNLTEAIEEFPGCHNFLCRSFMSLRSASDFQETGLASRIIKKVPALQIIFKKILDRTNFIIEEFPEIIFGKKSHLFLPACQHLLALKFLALSGDEGAQSRMLEFINMYQYNNIDMYQDDISERQILHTENGPQPFFLSSFTDDRALLEAGLWTLNHFLVSRTKTNTTIQLKVNLNDMESLLKYIFSTQPQLKVRHESSLFGLLRNIHILQKKKVLPLKPLTQEELNQLKTLEDFTNQAHKFALDEQYEEAEKILSLALVKLADSPSCYRLLQASAEVSLYLKKWKQAENDIEVLLKAFGDNKTLKGEKEDVSDLSDIQVLSATLCIWQKEFDKAYELLALALTNVDIGEGEGKAVEEIDELFRALNDNFDSIPEKIFKIIQKNQYIQEDYLECEDEDFLKYPKVYHRLQKGFFKKKTMKKKHKEIS